MANEDKRTWAEIDLGRLYHNYREVRRVLPEGCRFAGLCKACLLYTSDAADEL